MKQFIITLCTLCCLTAGAQQFQQEFGNPRKDFVERIATPNHSDSRYMPEQTATLRLTAREGGVPLPDGTVVRFKCGPEMMLPQQWDSTVFVSGEALICMGTMTEPGFLACQYEYMAGGHRQTDLVKVAFAPELINSYTQLPADFYRFWKQAVKEARKVDLEPEYYDVPDATNDEFVTQLVHLHVGASKWMYGYLTRPRNAAAGSCPVVLVPPGAGSGRIFPSDYFPRQGMVYLKIEIHGNDQRLDNDGYEALRRQCEGYERRGIESRDTYYYKDVYAGCVRAVDFLCSLPEWDGRNVIVTGGSQGGALTIVTAALSDKVTLCAPFYPALCDLGGFLHQRAGGWPKFFSPHYNGSPDESAMQTLQYYDVVNFARQLTVPTFMSWGYSDDTCSPTSVWAAWNAIVAPKQCDITPTSGHWRFSSSQEKCLRWMREQLRD
ncbi:MAG: acetylxylan esterase [Prevotella sp.]|nr:acetylxylan esterase [Prevotella sp.]